MLLIHLALACTYHLEFLINQIGYNADKLPLGKLSKSTILQVSYVDAFFSKNAGELHFIILRRKMG
jgi:hypothetical protein